MAYRGLTDDAQNILGGLIPDTPGRRIFIAVAASLFVHALVLWWPHFHLPHDRLYFGPMTVTLEYVNKPPTPEKKPTKELHKADAAHSASKTLEHETPPVQPNTAASIPPTANLLHQATNPAPQIQPSNVVAQPESKQFENGSEPLAQLQAWKLQNPGRFPRNIMLAYSVHDTGGGLKSADLICQFNSQGEQYTLRTVQKSSNPLALLSRTPPLVRISSGTLSNNGLRPEIFSIEGKQPKSTITFDWADHKLLYSDHAASDNAITLTDNAQDSMSLLFQLGFAYKHSFYPRFQETIPVSVLSDHKIEQYDLAIGAKEMIETPMGKIFALHFRRMHQQGEPDFEIWLGLDEFMLPVKFHTVNPAGDVVDEFLISDIRIRVSD
ncbi:MAG: DUF3108 domain-containing protein [Nitrosomonadales bacterium]